MSTIIVLQGEPDTGKTKAITILYKILRQNGYTVLQDKKKKNSYDFYVVLEKNGKKIGVTTYGDAKAILLSKINYFIDAQCEIIVCACHNWGKTVEAVNSIRGYTVVFIPKSLSDHRAQDEVLNERDAHTLFNRIEQLI